MGGGGVLLGASVFPIYLWSGLSLRTTAAAGWENFLDTAFMKELTGRDMIKEIK